MIAMSVRELLDRLDELAESIDDQLVDAERRIRSGDLSIKGLDRYVQLLRRAGIDVVEALQRLLPVGHVILLIERHDLPRDRMRDLLASYVDDSIAKKFAIAKIGRPYIDWGRVSPQNMQRRRIVVFSYIRPHTANELYEPSPYLSGTLVWGPNRIGMDTLQLHHPEALVGGMDRALSITRKLETLFPNTTVLKPD